MSADVGALSHQKQVQRMYDLTYELLETAEKYQVSIDDALANRLASVQDETARQKLTSLVREWLGPEIDRFIRLMEDEALGLLHRIYETDSLLDKSNLITEVML